MTIVKGMIQKMMYDKKDILSIIITKIKATLLYPNRMADLTLRRVQASHKNIVSLRNQKEKE